MSSIILHILNNYKSAKFRKKYKNFLWQSCEHVMDTVLIKHSKDKWHSGLDNINGVFIQSLYHRYVHIMLNIYKI